ncbi:sugar nucleotide-binding protein [Propionivibrio sp.]|uniref:SDR family oxidoreductase n=1 Tax=Propionivibrio sp. TaxID=2212460 RepID=UPI0025E957CB|nr:sugar nucleotide-binding protein [Propionivibrio sp.]MBK7354700.1 sugar nucleotide-binding protein [Propionivibrio sp.]
MDTILVTGSSGLLGSSLVPLIVQGEYTVITHARSGGADCQADLSVQEDVIKLLDKVKPNVIVNLAGLTDVDRCEAQPKQAYFGNVRTIENIVTCIKREKAACHLVQISTDQVYDGHGPHVEDQVALTNYYAFSKYAGELAAAGVSSTILRSNFFGRSRCPKRVSLTDWLYHSLSNNDNIQVFDDVLFSPLSMATLSEMIELSIRQKPVGVFNLGSHTGMSKAEFAFAFAAELDKPTSTMTHTSSDKAAFLKTYRPKDMRMDSSRFENVLAVKLPSLQDELKRVAREYHEVT